MDRRKNFVEEVRETGGKPEFETCFTSVLMYIVTSCKFIESKGKEKFSLTDNGVRKFFNPHCGDEVDYVGDRYIPVSKK